MGSAKFFSSMSLSNYGPHSDKMMAMVTKLMTLPFSVWLWKTLGTVGCAMFCGTVPFSTSIIYWPCSEKMMTMTMTIIEGSWPEWCISIIYYAWDTPFWSGTLKMMMTLPFSLCLWKTLRSMGCARFCSSVPLSKPVSLLATCMLCVSQSVQYIVSA